MRATELSIVVSSDQILAPILSLTSSVDDYLWDARKNHVLSRLV